MILDSTEYFARLSFFMPIILCILCALHKKTFWELLDKPIQMYFTEMQYWKIFSMPQDHLSWIEVPQTHNIFIFIYKKSIFDIQKNKIALVLFYFCKFDLHHYLSYGSGILSVKQERTDQMVNYALTHLDLSFNILRPEFQEQCCLF